MIDGLILSNVRTSSPNAILAPTPIKLQKHVVSSMTTPTMISSTSYSCESYLHTLHNHNTIIILHKASANIFVLYIDSY